MSEKFFKDIPYEVKYLSGRFWISLGCLSYGNYDNSCAVERANVRWLEENHEGKIEKISYGLFERGIEWKYNHEMGYEDIPIMIGEEIELILTIGDFGGTTAWLPWNEENDDILSALLDYPCIDEEMVYLIEQEIEMECWKDWIKKELIDEAFPDNPEWKEKVESLPDNVIFDYYLGIKEAIGEYFEVQAGGNGWIDVKRLAKRFGEDIVYLFEIDQNQ